MANAQVQLCGDVTGDGQVTIEDSRAIMRCTVRRTACPETCDVTADGRCNTSDARMIQRVSSGSIAMDEMPCNLSSILFVAATDKETYRVGEVPEFSFSLQNLSDDPVEIRMTYLTTISIIDPQINGEKVSYTTSIVVGANPVLRTSVLNMRVLQPQETFEELSGFTQKIGGTFRASSWFEEDPSKPIILNYPVTGFSWNEFPPIKPNDQFKMLTYSFDKPGLIQARFVYQVVNNRGETVIGPFLSNLVRITLLP